MLLHNTILFYFDLFKSLTSSTKLTLTQIN